MQLQFKIIFTLAAALFLKWALCQGQTLKVVGLNLIEQVFWHVQLYVGCSRGGTPDKLFVLTKNGKTKNIVYQEVVQNDF